MKYLVYCLLCVCIITSCELLNSSVKPAVSSEEDTLSNPFLLSQIDDITNPPLGDQGNQEFFYDNKSKLIKSVYNNKRSEVYIYSTYSYNTKGLVAKVITNSINNSNPLGNYERKYTYNEEGKWVKCIISFKDSTDYATMAYAQNKEILEYYSDGKILEYKIVYEYQNGNMIKSTIERFIYAPGTEVTYYEYTDIDNPFVQIDEILGYQFGIFNRYRDWLAPHTPSKKLIKSISYDNPRYYGERKLEFSYELDTLGLPSKVNYTDYVYNQQYNYNERYDYMKR
jgi:hypothetical protein